MQHTHDIRIRGDEVQKTFVRWDEDEPEREWTALQHLAAYAPDLAPRPVSTGTTNGQPTIVMSRLPGGPLTGELTPAQQSGFVVALRRLFAAPMPDGLGVRANDPLRFQPQLLPRLREPPRLALCQDPALVARSIEAAMRWLKANPPDKHWIVDPVLALGDGNLDNVVWDGTTARLVDWEEFGVSDLAYEVAGVVEHASSRLERRLDIAGLLTALSLSTDQQERLARHRRMFACFWLAMLLPGNGSWRRNPPGSTEDQARHVLQLLARDQRPYS